MKKFNLPLKIFLSLALLVFLLSIGLGAYAYQQFQPADPNNSEEIRFVVALGSGVQKIASDLQEAGLINNPLVFRAYVSLTGLDKKLQAGSFEISPSATTGEIATILTQGTQDTWIRLLEGWRREEIAEYLEKQELNEFSREQFLALTATSEGKLYPDTYLVPKDITTSALTNLLLRTFEQKVVVGLAEELASAQQPLDEILIMASLIEREARSFEQMRHVSGILWNRINISMPLQVDATLQYAVGYDAARQSWWSPPLAAHKSVVSPYNTYANSGLPPGPIANPGLNAIKAALDPLRVDDLFYLHASDGRMYYAQTLEEHNANVNTYLR